MSSEALNSEIVFVCCQKPNYFPCTVCVKCGKVYHLGCLDDLKISAIDRTRVVCCGASDPKIASEALQEENRLLRKLYEDSKETNGVLKENIGFLKEKISQLEILVANGNLSVPKNGQKVSPSSSVENGAVLSSSIKDDLSNCVPEQEHANKSINKTKKRARWNNYNKKKKKEDNSSEEVETFLSPPKKKNNLMVALAPAENDAATKSRHLQVATSKTLPNKPVPSKQKKMNNVMVAPDVDDAATNNIPKCLRVNIPASKTIPSKQVFSQSENKRPKPSWLIDNGNFSNEERKIESMLKTTQGILNKIVFNNFDNLFEQIMRLEIDNLERMEKFVDHIFQCSLKCSKFMRVYAQLFYSLQLMRVPMEKEEMKFCSFRKLLIQKCQLEFESTWGLVKTKEENRRKLSSTNLVALGRLIGELFKKRMLTSHIMITCIDAFIEKIDDESLMCLCTLLVTLGKSMTHKMFEDKLEIWFSKIASLSIKSPDSKISPRVRFMLLDVIDLRANKWVPRKMCPKWIEFINL